MKEFDIHKTFVQHVLNADENIPLELQKLIIPIGKLNVQRVMNVYSMDYKYRMLEALQSQFESVWMVLGDELFEKLIFEFIVKHPSQNADLNLYGLDFPIFLSHQFEILEDVPFIIDLANFEISFWQTFHAANPENKSLEQFTQERILNSFFVFDQSTQLLSYEHNIFPLFQFKDKKLSDFLDSHDQSIVLSEAYYLLYKQNGKIQCHTLSQSQFNLFCELNKNKSLIDVINSAEDITQEEMQEIFKLISHSLLRNLKDGK